MRMEVKEAEEETWSRETVPKVMRIVSSKLSQRDLISLLLVSPWLHKTLVSYPSLWLVSLVLCCIFVLFQLNIGLTDLDFSQVIDLREMNNAGNRLISALSMVRYE